MRLYELKRTTRECIPEKKLFLQTMSFLHPCLEMVTPKKSFFFKFELSKGLVDDIKYI